MTEKDKPDDRYTYYTVCTRTPDNRSEGLISDLEILSGRSVLYRDAKCPDPDLALLRTVGFVRMLYLAY
jgi:hypothetical protein